MSTQRRSYRFGPLERRGLLGPLSLGQGILVVLAGVVAIATLSLMPSELGAVLALAQFSLLAGTALISFAGRTLDEWAPLSVAFALRGARGERRWRSPLPFSGIRARAGSQAAPTVVMPPQLRGVKLIEIDYRGAQIAALNEPRAHRLTAVLACRADGFALLDPEAQERRLDRWGTLLATAADGPIRRLQWLERTVPARADELTGWLNEARDPAIAPRGEPIVESYLELIASGTRVANAHEILLAIQIDAPREGARQALAPRQILVEQLERVAAALAGAEVTVLGALAPGPLARTLRAAFDPYGAGELHDWRDARGGSGAGVAVHELAPLAIDEYWDHCRCDSALHASFWISDWPRIEVSPMFLDPVLGNSRIVRTVAVTMAPVAPERSAREVEAAVTRDRADRELRARFGQTETARQRQMQDATRQREAELAAGHGEVRLSGFVTISGRSEQELRVGCGELRQQAAQARLGLHRLYGQQAEAFSFTLPLARGLR